MQQSQAKPLALEGLTVIECGAGVSAAFAAKLLALMGARVIKVEAPEGDLTRRRGPFPGDIQDPERSGLFQYLNAGKYGVTLDLRQSAGRQMLDQLLAGAAILIHNVAPTERSALGLDNRELSQRFPGLIAAGISRFGDFGPLAHYRAYELNTEHASGLASTTPMASRSPELPPLKLFGHQGEYQAGIVCALASQAALLYRLKTGRGQALEVSEQECLAALMYHTFPYYSYLGAEISRLDPRSVGPWMVCRCADGEVLICATNQAQWRALLDALGHPAWATAKIFADPITRSHHEKELQPFLEEEFRHRNKLELRDLAQANRVPLAPLSTMAELYADDHLRARNYWTELPGATSASGAPVLVPSVPFKSSVMGWRMDTPAPHLGQDNRELLKPAARGAAPALAPASATPAPAAKGPLAGIRVLDFTWVVAGPHGTLNLAHLGAEVIRVESAGRLCGLRNLPPWADDQRTINRAGRFNDLNQGKRSIQINLARPEGVELALKLATHCDVVVENFAPGVINRMGLGYERMRAVKPDIVMASISGYGQSGPKGPYVSYGPLLTAEAGMCYLSGYPHDGIPREPGVPYPDPVGGLSAAYAIIAALIHRQRTGEGQYLDVALWEALLMMLPEACLEYAINGREPKPMGNRDLWMAPHNCYKAAGGSNDWLSIAVGSEQEWQALCNAIGRPELSLDPRFRTASERKRNEDELDRLIGEWTVRHNAWDGAELLQAAGVAAVPTLTNKDLATHPHLHERGYLTKLEHPEAGVRIHNGIPWRMSGTPCLVWRAAPTLGQDTDYVLREVMRLESAEIERMRREEILH